MHGGRAPRPSARPTPLAPAPTFERTRTDCVLSQGLSVVRTVGRQSARLQPRGLQGGSRELSTNIRGILTARQLYAFPKPASPDPVHTSCCTYTRRESTT